VSDGVPLENASAGSGSGVGGVDPITDLGAVDLSEAIHRRELSCRDVMSAYLDRVHRLNPIANAIVNMADHELLMAAAADADGELDAGRSRGWMHGVPIAVKDLNDVVGFPTTSGNRMLQHFYPKNDGLLAERMRGAGAIVIGKTNVPEFGLGSHTFNDVFGATPNAYDPDRTAGGSSGGAAAALANRLVPVADGSDYMGSLRNPAGWNNIFGFRPSQGRVPSWPTNDVWIAQLATDGPMGRSVADVAALLSTQAGMDERDAGSIPEGPQVFSADPVELRGLRIGWLGDLDGHLPMDPGVLDQCESGLRRFSDAGAIVEPAAISVDLDRVWQAWLTWRWTLVGAGMLDMVRMDAGRGLLKPEAMWEHERSQAVTARHLMAASAIRTSLYQAMLGLFEGFDCVVLPTAQVWPFPIDQRFPDAIAGRQMDTYHRWMETTLYATFCGLPALSVPVGFGSEGLSMGMQLIGRPRGDAAILSIGASYERLIADLLAIRPRQPE
jgi:amidase